MPPLLSSHFTAPDKALWNTRGTTAPGLKTTVLECLQIMGPRDLCFDFCFRVKSWDRVLGKEDTPLSTGLSLKLLCNVPAREYQRW